MRNIFTHNGVTSSKIICRLAQQEFGDIIRESNIYVTIKRDIFKTLRKMKTDELEENRLDTLVGIEYLTQNDFGNFVSLRFAYWGLTLAIVVMIIGDVPVYEYFNMSKYFFGNVVTMLLSILLVTTSITIHMQHDQMEYLKFKLLCIDELYEKRKIFFMQKAKIEF